jgi:hypothetical protein
LAIDATSVREAIASAPGTRRVFHEGRLVASVDQRAMFHRAADGHPSGALPTTTGTR